MKRYIKCARGGEEFGTDVVEQYATDYPDFDFEWTPDKGLGVVGYFGTDTRVDIPTGVDYIQFFNADTPDGVVLHTDVIELSGPSVKEINDVKGIEALTKVYLPKIEVLPEGCFSDCINLEVLDTPKVRTVEGYVCENCPKLDVINVADNAQIADTAFDGMLAE